MNASLFRSLLFILTLFMSGALHARTLYWQNMQVHAQLRADGSLHVTERQHYVFDGYWNGGERRFNVGWGQQLTLVRVSRIDPVTQARTNLVAGDVKSVDHYTFKDNVLRWRSRLPSDPPFHSTHLIYELEYIYTGILRYENGTYLLKHDFAFGRRPGEFQHYLLTLDVDHSWRSLTAPLPARVEKTHLPPGVGVVLQARLQYQGLGVPAYVRRAIPLSWRVILVACFALFMLVYLIYWLRHETAKGRFAPLVPVSEIDEAWLSGHVLNRLPEEIGSLWDLQTGAAEVAAILARMTQEGKLKSYVTEKYFWIFKQPVLHLELAVQRSELPATEHKLINKLFPQGNRTDTDYLRKYYRRSGFDPAAAITNRLQGDRLKSAYAKKRDRSRRVTWVSYLAALICALIGLIQGNNESLFFVIPAVFIAIIGIIFFLFNAQRLLYEVEAPRRTLAKSLLVYLVLAIPVCAGIISGYATPAIWFVLMALLVLSGLYAYILDSSRTGIQPELVAMRKALCAARRYFLHELKQKQPCLRDEWYPYLIAFGLDDSVQRWFREYGSSLPLSSRSGLSSSHSAASSSNAAWTGGGGSFGGGGATGAWTAAAATMAAGISAPSSGSGGGSGGGSSGGGGGGGW